MKELLSPLLRRVVQPFRAWIAGRPWWVAFCLLMVVAGVSAAVKYPEAVTEMTSGAGRYARFALSFGKLDALPERQTSAVQEKTTQWALAIDSRLDRAAALGDQAWATAQILIALQGMNVSDIPKDVVARFFRERADAQCHCWKKFPQPHLPESIAVSAWVLWAMAVYGVPAEPEELDFVFKAQRLDGWWPMFAGAGEEKFASSYATAVAVIALYEQGKLAATPSARQRLNAAVTRGVTWLQGRVAAGKARWADYPAWPIVTGQQESIAISGFVHFALHQVGAIGLKELDRDWLANLPKEVSPALHFDASNKTVLVQPGNRTYTDDARYYGLPWSIAATVRAYSNGTLSEQLRAIEWLERAFAPGTSFHGLTGTREDDWVAAEMLIALKAFPQVLGRL